MNKIGIFDSGIGGVTVLKEILKVLPNENYIYYSDSKNNPYGDKTDNEIKNICDNIVKYLISQKCQIIVIACNTASAKAAQYLRETYPDTLFVAIEPAYKMVYDYAYDKTTLVMATKGTIESEKFNLLLKKYDNHKTILLPCVGLADIIENGNVTELKDYLTKNIKPYQGQVQNVVLGCTHYPLIEKEIRDILGNVTFFNGAPNLAKHLKDILIEDNLIKNDTNNNENITLDYGKITFIDSQVSNQASKVKEERFYSLLNS